MKAVVCIHGFGGHAGGQQTGFSLELRRAAEERLGAEIPWLEALWNDLLDSPDISSSVSMLLESYRAVNAYYKGDAGNAIRARVCDVVAEASAKSQEGVVLVGYSFGAAIAYDVAARGLVPNVRELILMGSPMGLIRQPELLVKTMLGGKMQGMGSLMGLLGGITAQVAGMANIDFGRLPAGVNAVAFRNPEDILTVDFGDALHNVEQREIAAPQGTKGFEHHRLYWYHPDIADWLARVLSNGVM